jgi:hypothetical protein
VTPEMYQAEILSRLDLGLWLFVGVGCIVVFSLAVLLVKAVW